MVPYVTAFIVFAAMTAACWFVSVSVYKSTVDHPDVAALPNYLKVALLAVLMVTLTSFIQFPGGYFAGVAVWAVATFAGLGLSTARAAILFAYLAVSSLVSRLVVLGIMDMFFGG